MAGVDRALQAAEAGRIEEAAARYDTFHEVWEEVEDGLHTSNRHGYEAIEAAIREVRVQLAVQPPRFDALTDALLKLKTEVAEYVPAGTGAAQAGNDPAGSTGSPASDEGGLGRLAVLLDQAAREIDQGKAGEARERVEAFVAAWPGVEGEVRSRSPRAYEAIERNMAQVMGALASTPPDLERAGSLVAAMEQELAPIVAQAGSSYTAFDAGVVLLREGLEVLLVLLALLAFLQRTGHAKDRVWVWGGTAAGVAVAVGLGVALRSLLQATMAGWGTEMVEGTAGLVAAGLMLTVGAWLHDKANLAQWNAYIQSQVGQALARGSLISLALIAFLAVLREGAETVVFYMGMAASIATSQLVLGIAGASLLLVAAGVAALRFGARLPVRPLFLVATVLIYYLAFKFTGQAIHGLQIAQELPATAPGYLPSISFLGIHPTWEGVAAQLVMLALIVLSWMRTTWRAAVKQARVRAGLEPAHRS
ncbi:FTR1 family iron permease [Limnochorda pilosa]|nr:FTR1 family protein [Limnochorda pilosa]